MNRTFAFVPALALGVAALAHAQGTVPTKVGIINIQSAILSTKDGQKAAGDLQTRFTPKRGELDKKKADIDALQDQLRKGNATMSPEAKEKLMRDIDAATKTLNRETEDAQADLTQAQDKVMQEMLGKIQSVLDKYAKENGYTLILDVSNPQTPVLWASSAIEITNDIVTLYDKMSAPAPAAAPAAAKPPAAKPPAAAPAAKK